ncbi:MAG: succinylglutamate-semialdehyde dehydrogenase [Alphaproteobacteria bacterium]|nr:succinylglutamate-semialdehyde dehydrogenase [Alphaproteobacteria bacterium]
MTAASLTGDSFIGGQWRRGAGRAFVSLAPADGAPIWRGTEASDADVDDAIAAARGAFDGWRRTPLEDRIALVRKFAGLVEANKAEMAALISRETGKPVWDAATEAAAMVGKAGLSVKAYEERTPTREAPAGAFTARISHHPHGVMAVLGPFNFPGHLPNGHIMPALIAGNTVVFKPSEQTPAVAEFTVRLWEEAGIPAGVVNLVQGAKSPAQHLVSSDRVDGVLFTGGVPAGRAIHAALGGKPEKIVALELGGNNPLVVWDAADVASAARIIVKSAYITAGQRCTCARRLIIPDGARGEALLAALSALIDRLVVGLPDAEPQPFIGPVISDKAAAAVLAAQQSWLKVGATAIREARRLDLGAAYVSPGLVDVTDMPGRKDEEVFGPILQVIRVADFDAALEEANATRFGLAAGLISDDPALFSRFANEVRAGVLNWNRQTTGASGSAPFGGVGQSGNHRAAGFYAADYSAWPMASLIAPGPVKDEEPITGLRP